MSYMRLAPESVRLRRMAKAYAAGELTQQEYRDARRQVIDNFPVGAVAEDDTRPRWSQEPTLRSDNGLAECVGEPAAAAGTLQRSRRWPWVALLGVLLAAAMLVVPAAGRTADAALDIVPVAERHPDPASSPRLPLTGVQVSWGGDAPGDPRGVDLAALQARAEEALTTLRTSNAPGPHGFTPSELEEVARFLDVLGAHDAKSGLDAADARDLTGLIRDQKTRRGISVAELEGLADDLQAQVRAAGYFLAVAYVPAQRLQDGVARVEVLPGRLGDIVVEGGDAGPVREVFAALLGQPLRLADVSSRLQTLNARPGITAQASFGPGADVGESRLRLDLIEQRDWTAAVAVDNHGDSQTGDQRISVSGAWLNPRDVGDRLSAGALATANPANQVYGYVDYEMPLAGDYRLAARLANNDFSQDDPRSLDGSGVFVDLAARRSFVYSRERALTLVLGLGRHQLDWDDGVNQTVSLLSAALAGHRVWDGPRIAADGALSVSLGRVGGDRFAGQDDGFYLLEAEAEAWMPVTLPLLEGQQTLRVFGAGQWSDSLLPATRRFAVGGAHGLRAFDRSAFLADRGLLLGLEARVPLPLGELLVFGETAYGDGRAEGNETWVRLTDVGLGWDANLGPGWSSRLSWALPVATRGSGGFDDDGSRWYGSLRYRF